MSIKFALKPSINSLYNLPFVIIIVSSNLIVLIDFIAFLKHRIDNFVEDNSSK